MAQVEKDLVAKMNANKAELIGTMSANTAELVAKMNLNKAELKKKLTKQPLHLFLATFGGLMATVVALGSAVSAFSSARAAGWLGQPAS